MEDNYQQQTEFEETKINPVNDVVLWKAIALFLVAIIGLDLIATVFSLIAKAIFGGQLKDNLPLAYRVSGVLQFLTYAVGIGIFLVIVGNPT